MQKTGRPFKISHPTLIRVILTVVVIVSSVVIISQINWGTPVTAVAGDVSNINSQIVMGDPGIRYIHTYEDPSADSTQQELKFFEQGNTLPWLAFVAMALVVTIVSAALISWQVKQSQSER